MLQQTFEASPPELSRLVDSDPERNRRGMAETRALIGDDVRKGVDEARRLRAAAKAAYARESFLQDEHVALHGDKPIEEQVRLWETWAGADEAEMAATEAGERADYAIFYVWKMPIRSFAEAGAKARFAIEFDDYWDDEDLEGDVLRQIADFLAPHGLQTAAE